MQRLRVRPRRGPAAGVGSVGLGIERCEPRLLWAAHVAGSATAYATIQAAVNAAPTGGTVTVDAGTYPEQVTVSKKLTIRGAQAGADARANNRLTATAATESVVTGAAGASGKSSAFHVLANDVTIDGFTVTGETNQDDALGAGVVIGPGQSGTQVVNDVVRGNVSGLFLANASSTDAALVQHCYFSANNNPGNDGGRGIYTDGTISGGKLTDVTIDANTFANNRGSTGTTGYEAAVAFEAASPGEQSAIRITNNTMVGNGKAVLFFNATGVLIQGNTVTGTLDHWSGSLRFEGDNSNVRILYNTVSNNTGPGVAVDSKGTPGDSSGFIVNDDNFVNDNDAYATRIGVAVDFSVYDGTFDARDDYWGAASGPGGQGPGTGDAVGGGHFNSSLGWQLTAVNGTPTYAPFSATPVPAPASTVPAAPSNLTATATGATVVALAWTDNAAGNETGFTVQRSGNGGSTFATVGTTATGTTSYADAAGLTAGTRYVYRVMAVNAAGTSGASNAATVTTAAATTATVSLTTLKPTSSTVGWGTVRTDASISGNPITLRGTVYPLGIGTHASSTITYALAGKYATFATDVGVDDEAAGQGAVDFALLGDGRVLYDSGVATGTSPVGHATVSVAGVQTLTLRATPGVAGTIDYDHADWANPRLTTVAATPTATAAPALRTGTTIGTPGSYAGAGNTAAKATDGNLSTYFDGPAANGNWVGLDLGSATPVSELAFAPRVDYASRMVGGVFQASTSATFATGVTTLYTVTVTPAAGVLTTVTLASPVTARYVRYLSPNRSYGDVAEVAWYG